MCEKVLPTRRVKQVLVHTYTPARTHVAQCQLCQHLSPVCSFAQAPPAIVMAHVQDAMDKIEFDCRTVSSSPPIDTFLPASIVRRLQSVFRDASDSRAWTLVQDIMPAEPVMVISGHESRSGLSKSEI